MSSQVSELASRKAGQNSDIGVLLPKGISPNRSSSQVNSGGSKRRESQEPVKYQNIQSKQLEMVQLNVEGKESYLNYLQNNTSALQQKVKRKGTKDQVFSVLGGSILNSKVKTSTAIEDVVRGKMRKSSDPGATPYSQVNAPTKLTTVNDYRTPSDLHTGQVKRNREDSLGQIVEVNTFAKEYGLGDDNYTLNIKRQSENSSTFDQHHSLLKNEILRNTHTPIVQVNSQSGFNDKNDKAKALQDLLAKKQFEQQQVLQVAKDRSALRNYEQKSKMSSYRKDGKDIGDLLSYKDYALDKKDSRSNRSQLVNKIMEMSMREEKPTNFGSVLGSMDYENEQQNRIIKNSYHPSFSLGERSFKAKSQIRVPEALKSAFLNRKNEELNTSLPGFHITDLLPSTQRSKQLASVLDQSQAMEAEQNEYVIKNYRLIQKKKRDFFLPMTRQSSPNRNEKLHISSTAPQSPIRVSNSVLTPNTFHFSTKISPSNQLPWNNDKTQIMLPPIDNIRKSEVSINEAKFTNLLKKPPQSPTKFSQITEQQYEQEDIVEVQIKEEDAPEFDLENIQTPDLLDVNYQDMINSWLDPNSLKQMKTKKSRNETQEEENLQREYSASRIFNQGSSDSLQVENIMIKKLKPQHQMYKDQLLSTSIEQRSRHGSTIESKHRGSVSVSINPNEDPYGHLKARNVFVERAEDFQKQIELTMQIPDQRNKVRLIIELNKEFLTHLDKQTLSADRLPLELFDDFLSENEIISQRIEERRRQGKSPLRAKSHYFLLNGAKEETDARVLAYDRDKKKYLIEFQSQGKTLQKHAGRLNIHFVDFESREQIEQRRTTARILRKEAQSKLYAERLFINELSRKYDYLRLPKRFKQNIKKKLVIDLDNYDQERVKLLVMQVEALFVFSILKSVIYSQIGDPFISRIVAQYKIEDKFDGQVHLQEETPYFALKSYEEQGKKLEKMLNRNDARLILQDYAIVGKKSFIDAIQFLIQQNEEIVVKTPIFEFPVSHNLMMFVLQQDEFKGKQIDKYKIKLRTFPISMQNLLKSQRILAKRFKETLEVRWTENIAKKIEKIVDKEFDQNSREISRKTLNPYVLKLFELIRLFQEKNMYDKLYSTLETYLQFLLQFAIRDEDFRSANVYKQYNMEQFRVIMNQHPMIKVEVKIKKTPTQESLVAVNPNEKKEKEHKKSKARKQSVLADDKAIRYNYEIVTKPQLGDVWMDFVGMIDMFLNSVSRIRRIDEIVISQLKLKKNTLRQPDIDKDEKFEVLTRMINSVIENMKQKPDKRVQKLQRYLPYLQMTFESILFELKKRSYEEQYSESEPEDSMEEKGTDTLKENLMLQDAYKNIEISEVVYIDKFNDLRQVFWDVQLSVQSVYDFGIVNLDCSNFKLNVKKHIERLLNSLTKYVITEFLTKMNNLFNQFEVIERKATESVHTIDEVIHLIDYIDKIQKNDDMMNDLENYLNVIKNRKEFIDTLQLKLTDQDFLKYLNLFSYPNRLKSILLQRKADLENERAKLSEQMNKEKEKIIVQINTFREHLEQFKSIGLTKPAVPAVVNFPNDQLRLQTENRGSIKKKASSKQTTTALDPVTQLPITASEAVTKTDTPADPNQEMSPNNSRQEEIGKRNSSLYQKKRLAGEDAPIFNPTQILEMSDQMDRLKMDLEQAEEQCNVINRREKLLNMRVTKFSQVASLQNEIKPFINLWQIAAQYTRVYENWLYGNFYDLASDQIEENISEWWKQLTRVSKTHISNYEEPMQLVQYLIGELEKFKDYMPMVTALRSKGLEKRHWQMLSKQLGFEIEPQNLTLFKLIERKMYEGQRLDIIKGVSEIAIKEYAIKTTLDALEHELRVMEFQHIKYKETNTHIIKGVDDLITSFEESSIKILALKQNQYAKHFIDKILRVEKELKIIVDVLDEWVKAQKSWVYLDPIFLQNDIAKQMPNEAQKFYSLDSFYKKEISTIVQDPSVLRYCRRDGLISQLQYVNKEFESITKGLSFYLEAKREYFARFYFLSNEEIIEILGQMREPRNVQRFLNKIFEGIDYLGFMPSGEIIGIYSKEDEYVQLRNPILCNESAENWLKSLEFEMKESVKHVIHQSVVDIRMRDFESWVKSWQGQVVVVVMDIILTETLTEIFNNGETTRLKDVLKQVIFEIETLTRMIRTKLDYNARILISSLLTNRVHARDTIKNMIESDVRYSTDFLWKLQMKYEYKLQRTLRRPKKELSQITFFEQSTPVQNEILSKPTTPAISKKSQPLQEEGLSQVNEVFSDKRSLFSGQQDEDAKSQHSIKTDKSMDKKSNKSNEQKKPTLNSLEVGDQTNKTNPIIKNFKRRNTLDRDKELESFKYQETYTLNVSMIDAQRPYGYEYLGNTSRIVITPLTDRCYRALFMALHFNYGGSPEGPVGTGKTETTKDLSKCLAKQCFVFNCSSSLNYVAMTKFFKGLATSGAWSCFDEFNRIDLTVLSVISQIIIVIQGAIREHRSELIFEDTPISFNKDCAIFITMNPQYIGRTELPDNLKSLFRPVAMIVPDSVLISEILLYSFGFLQAKPLARKIVRAFNLAKQQLSNQIHYDFGLRTIKIVLQIAGLMKLKASGVIEPDFKIKENKKKSKNPNEKSSDTNVAATQMTFADSPVKMKGGAPLGKGKKGFSSQKKQKLMQMAAKRRITVKKQASDSSLNSDLIINSPEKSPRSDPLESTAVFALENKNFFKAGQLRQSQQIDSDEEDEVREAREAKERDDKYMSHSVFCQRALKSSKKFQGKRRTFARGNIEKVMLKRMEFLEEHKDEAKQTRKLMKVLGIEDESIIEDEEKIEEFIVLRSINDTNVPKLHQTDTIIFKGITDDIFPNTLQTVIKQGSLKNLIEQSLKQKSFQVTEDITQRILHLYDSVMIRHGVMVVGSTFTGKTSSINMLQDALNKSRDNEIDEKIQQYKIRKAKRLGLQNQDSSFEEQNESLITGIDLTPEEIRMIKAQCRNKGVVTYTINPKSITMGQLMGTYDEVSHDWNDGIMANVMRNCSKDISERRKWIVFDGPIDPVWVENLNSVMDDNKKLTLSTGETIKMTGMMTIVIEAEDLTNCTPATISRCGMIYMKDDIIPLKAILNEWIKSLPDFLQDCGPEIDTLCNYFIPDILDSYIHQSNLVTQLLTNIQIYPVSQKWAIKNFCKYMNSLINDYRSEKFNSNNAAAFNIYQNNSTTQVVADNMTQNTDEQTVNISSKMSTVMAKRAYHVQFADIDTRFQNAYSFFLFSLVWAFGSIIKASLRKDFERQLKSKIMSNSEELSTIAQLKSKMQKKGGQANKDKAKVGEQVNIYEPSQDFKEPEKPPYFLCAVPPTYSLFEVFFDLETNSWVHWDSIKSNQKLYSEEESKFKKKGSYFNKFIPTTETVRLSYIMESNIVCKNNLLLIGPTGCGKSWLSREVVFRQMPSVTQKLKCYSLVFSNNSTAEKTQHYIDSRLERRRKGYYGPPYSTRYVFYIDDLMMPFKDDYGIQSANELLRQWFDFSGWYDHRTLDFKKIEDIQFLSCITVYESHKNVISGRNEWHWAYLGTLNMDERHHVQLFSQIIENFSVNWPTAVQGMPINSIIRATLDLYSYFERHVKPTPSKFLYIYNTRHIFKIIYGLSEIEPSYLKSEFELAKLWVHESWRTLCDRISDYGDKKILYGKFNEIARKHFKIGKNKLSKKIGYPFFCSFNKGHDGQYMEVEDMKETTMNLRKYLSEYNEINKKQRINIVLFEFLVEFLIKVHRMIKQPFSHGILIGIEGSGKHQISQMACFLANFMMYQIKLEANYTQDDWYQDLKNILLTAGVDQKEVVFHLKHNEIIKEDFLEDINTLVNNGEIQGLFTKEEYENIISQASIRGSSNDKKDQANNQLILADFQQKCRENLKVLLNFTPTGANLRSRIRNYKSIVNCSTIIWMDSWPQEGYKEVAEVLLKEEEVVNRDLVLEIAISIHMETIALAKNYFYETQHYLYITPHSFTDYINTYKDLFEQKRTNLKELQDRYETGLERLKNTQEQVEKFQQQLENNSPMLLEKQIEIEKLLEQLKEEHTKVGKRRDLLMKEEEELKSQKEQAEKIKEECEYNLNKATPELFAAIGSLQNLSKQEINELKTLKNPPNAVKLLMEAICLFLNVEPIKFKAKDGITMQKDYWAAATSKHVLGNPKFQDNLVNFDHNKLDADMMAQLEELTENPEFVYENVARASKAARGLFQWIQALKHYYYIYKETQPKRDALYYAEKQRVEKEEQIRTKTLELNSLEDNLNALKQDHLIKEHEIRILQRQIDECSLKKERATKLLNGLGGEKQKWLVCNRMIAKKFLTIQGDVLLGAAFITYLSAFTQKYREQCVEKWELMIKNFGIRISDDFNFNRVFGDQIKIKEWNFNGLPSDSFSISNAIILEHSQKQCICIDPQYQASKWIKIQEMANSLQQNSTDQKSVQQQSYSTGGQAAQSNDLKILNFSDVNFVQSFELAMKFGKKVLIENVGQKIDLILYPLLKRDYITEGSHSVSIFGHMVEVDKNFRLFIASELRNPHFGPDISVLVNFVNFYVTLEGLEEQMLSIVISNQKADLEDETIRMKKEALDYIKILKKLENDILAFLHNDMEQILSDEQLIETLNNSKKTGRQIAENLQKVNKASNKILRSRGIYTPAAYRASLLYFLVSDLAKIEVMYQFSLKWYIDIFTEEVKQKKHTDQDPLLDIIRNFTYTLYRKVCQSIFEKDKLLFTFLLAYRILEGENCLNMRLFEFFIRGPQLKDYEQEDKESDDSDYQEDEEGDFKREQMRLRKSKCPWVSEPQWLALEKLAKIPPFHRPNIAEHMVQNSEAWYSYIFQDNVQMPGPYNDYDFEKEAKLAQRMKEVADTNISTLKDKKKKSSGNVQDGVAGAAGTNLKEIKEVNEEEEQIDEKIWGLDEDEVGENNQQHNDLSEGEDDAGKDDMSEFIDDREQIADSLVMGVSEYHEFRLGSVRFEKEMITKKQQVMKDLLKFCFIRIFRPERIVREIQRFLGSVLDPRFMEPPVFNLASLYKETSSYSPLLFILSPSINTLNELQILKYQIQQENIQIDYMPMGSNNNDKVQQLILKSAVAGNWLLLENLHLVTDWVPTLEKFIHTMYKEDRKDMHTEEHSDNEQDTNRLGENSQMISPNYNINQFPELKGCRINSKFRLWLSSMPVDYFPVSFLQECMKITLQPAQGIRQNALKILNSVNYDFLQRCPKRQSEFRKLFFALCIFHSVVGERQRFGPIGWSQPYYFSENDFLISGLQLQSLIFKAKDGPLPLDLIKYVIGTLNYGGRIIKKQDEITLNALLNTFLSDKAVSEPTYRLTGFQQGKDSGIYYIPGDGDLQQYKVHISKFPIQDRPEIFGLHENATIMRSTNEGKNLLERVFEFEFASKEIIKASSAMLESNEDANMQKYSKIKKRIQSIIEDLPELLDEELCKTKFPISYEHCINVLITKEVQRYNTLLQVIYVSLKNTLKALEGVIHINNVLEEIYKALTFEQVPKTWYKYCYPSFKSLSNFLSNLKERTSFIRNWLTSGNHPFSFWISGFFDQQSFLTMILQQKARQQRISIDLLSIEYSAMPRTFGQSKQQLKPPEDGCYIYGLLIEGANWSDEEKQLVDCDSRQLYQEMPMIHVQVILHADFEQKYQNDNYYHCPLYLISMRERLEADFTHGLVTTIPLPIGNAYPGFWVKRGTALLCQKEE